MSCSHCEHAVKTAALSLDGVSLAEVSLSAGTLTVEFAPETAGADAIRAAVEDQGYDVEI